jgi:hypothetical protein
LGNQARGENILGNSKMEGSVGSAEKQKGETDNATFNLRFPISLGIWFSVATIRSSGR